MATASPRSLLGLVALIAAVSLATQWWIGRTEQRLADEVAALASAGDIRMVSSLTCPYCTQARQWFERHGVPFDECFVERDAACRATFEALPVRATPTLIVRGQVITGFRAEQVAAVLRGS